MKGTYEYTQLMASIGVVDAQENAYNVDKLKETIDQYKEKMVRVKDTLMKEKGEGQEMKRKHEATRSEFVRLQEAYQVLESEKEDLVLSNTINDGEKKDLENKISELEAQKAATSKQGEELNAWVVELEAQNNSLEIQLKEVNERYYGEGRGEGKEMKRKHEATLSEFKRL